MLQRMLVLLVVLFWAVMTVLLVREAYFPEGSDFAHLPPADVFRIFLDRGASVNALHVYRGDKKLGHAMFTPRRGPAEGDYTLLVSGMLDKGAVGDLGSSVAWRVNIRLRGASAWGGATGQLRLPEEGLQVDFEWEEGRGAPRFAVLRHGVLVTDHRAIEPLLGQAAAGGGGAASLPEGPDGVLRVTARGGSLKMAGQRRRGYFLEFRVLDHYQARAFFTEAGELALVELPGGYRALEPVIHGLVPDEPDDEQG